MAKRRKPKRETFMTQLVREIRAEKAQQKTAARLAMIAQRKRPELAHAVVNGDGFLRSFEWRRVRMQAIKKYGPRCQCCGASAPAVVIHVDHIKPRRIFPELALSLSNLQILCEDCNHGKGNWDMTDWRATEAAK